VNPSRIHPLAAQVVIRLIGVSEEDVGEAICDDAVDLLGHGRVAGAQSRLDMRLGDARLGGHQCSC
jgi:hypothetical protein